MYFGAKKIPLAENVCEARLCEAVVVFDTAESICISFSGGKDSTVLFHLVAEKDIGIIVNDERATRNTSGTGVWEDIADSKGRIETVAGMRRNIILYTPNS